jgi:ABC-type antimicrobial peptide transport system permease subunit
MFETLAVTAFGGLIGLLIAAGLCRLVPVFGLAEFIGTPSISPFVGTLTASLLGVIGFLAGWFPAREAAGLDPVVAMKL